MQIFKPISASCLTFSRASGSSVVVSSWLLMIPCGILIVPFAVVITRNAFREKQTCKKKQQKHKTKVYRFKGCFPRSIENILSNLTTCVLRDVLQNKLIQLFTVYLFLIFIQNGSDRINVLNGGESPLNKEIVFV